MERELPAKRPLFIGSERKGKWQRKDQKLNIRVKTVEMYMKVMRRVGVKVEMLGREKMEWREGMTVREKSWGESGDVGAREDGMGRGDDSEGEDGMERGDDSEGEELG